jgi:hypothetical protein
MEDRTRLSRVDLDKFLGELPSDYSPIKQLVQSFDCSDIYKDEGGNMLMGHEPEIAPLAFAVTVFPGVQNEAIEQYEHSNQIVFPEPLKEFLNHINGAYLCELNIYGIPLSMLQYPPKLSRSIRNPLNVATATKIWRVEFNGPQVDEFHFASRNISWTVQIGYFWRPDGSVVSYPLGKAEYQSRAWPTFTTWLHNELGATLRDRPSSSR